jgi:cytochrome c oxidase subunit 1
MFGRMYNEKLAKLYIAILFVGFNMLYFPMFILGYMGMPRRYYDYLPEFANLNLISTIGSWILAAGLILMAYNLIRSAKKGEKADINPWGGITLEWTIPSPPPHENFEKIPTIEHGAYDYGIKYGETK